MAYIASDFPCISRMFPVTLSELKAVSLMNRIDTKFMASIDVLSPILEEVCSAGYRICEIDGERLLRYTSVYYDTDDLEMFRVHRNGKKTRQKTRVRTYHINGDSYLEIKNKKNTGRTKKKRILIPSSLALDITSYPDAARFIEQQSKYRPDRIMPSTSTDFHRITITDSSLTERVTIDINLNFYNHRNNSSARIEDVVIIEVKQDGKKTSRIKEILLKHRVFPYKVSKYCLSVILTDKGIHQGRYKEKIRHINKITGQK